MHTHVDTHVCTRMYTATEAPAQALSTSCLRVRAQGAGAAVTVVEVLVPACTDEMGDLQKESCM